MLSWTVTHNEGRGANPSIMQDHIAFLQQLLCEAGDLALATFQNGAQQIRHKSTSVDLVTEADLAVEAHLLGRLRARFPGDGFLAEESGVSAGNGRVWIVDPIDGTTNFAHRLPIFGITVALQEDQKLVLGVTRCPPLHETYWAVRGGGAWMQADGQPPRRLHVSRTATLQQSVLASGFPYTRATSRDNNLAEFSAFIPLVQGVRRAGAATVDLCWLADGRLDGYWEANLQPWDWAAGVLFVKEAGGAISNYEGEPWQLGDSQIVASNGLIHQQMLEVIQQARREMR